MARVTRIRRIARVLLRGTLFAASFCVVARLLPPPRSSDPLLSAKLAYFEQHAHEYDGVFFGSSRVFRGFDTETFARKLRVHGHKLRVFNFGIGAMRPHELNALMHRVLVNRPSRIKFVFVELMDWTPTILASLRTHDRTRNWHTPTETFSALETVWHSETAWAERWSKYTAHLSWMLAKYTNAGEGMRFVETWTHPNIDHDRYFTASQNHHGFFALDWETGPRYEARRNRFVTENIRFFRRQIKRIPQENDNATTGGQSPLRAQVLQQKQLRRLGVEPIYVIPNLRWGTPNMQRLHRDGHLAHLFAFNSTRKFPQLYAEELYFDRGHLNRRGAEIFSGLLADQFAAWLDEHPLTSQPIDQ